jgi:hypothetical protein
MFLSSSSVRGFWAWFVVKSGLVECAGHQCVHQKAGPETHLYLASKKERPKHDCTVPAHRSKARPRSRPVYNRVECERNRWTFRRREASSEDSPRHRRRTQTPLPKVKVAGSNPVFRSIIAGQGLFFNHKSTGLRHERIVGRGKPVSSADHLLESSESREPIVRVVVSQGAARKLAVRAAT